jgi:hypothetical protein
MPFGQEPEIVHIRGDNLRTHPLTLEAMVQPPTPFGGFRHRPLSWRSLDARRVLRSARLTRPKGVLVAPIVVAVLVRIKEVSSVVQGGVAHNLRLLPRDRDPPTSRTTERVRKSGHATPYYSGWSCSGYRRNPSKLARDIRRNADSTASGKYWQRRRGLKGQGGPGQSASQHPLPQCGMMPARDDDP